jgi:hypothetical protein
MSKRPEGFDIEEFNEKVERTPSCGNITNHVLVCLIKNDNKTGYLGSKNFH